MYLTSVDYAVTIIMLMIPLGIGIFYAWKDSRSVNREEYLLGGRKMKMLPVSLSMLVTFQSALSLIGFTSDVYRNGVMLAVFYIGAALGSLVGCYTMVPVMHPLKMTSIFDYLEMRYKSRAVRMFCTVVGMLQTYFYMVMALIAPALALQAAANIPYWMSVAVVGSIGTVYTAIGGFKSVIWTDVFQTVIMVAGLLLLIVKGTVAIGGPERAWTVAEEGGRTNMMEFSPDPRERHTWWSLGIGTTCIWMSNIYAQSSFQRVSSLDSVEKARMSLFLNIPFMIIYDALIMAVGILIYSYFYVTRCDPLGAGIISNMNQVSLYFMLDVFRDWRGLAGFYMATIFSGALSTLSSGINALAANTVEDILAGLLVGVSEKTATIVTKGIVFVYGFTIIGLAYLLKSVSGPISQLSVAIMGSFGSVAVGVFLMGSMVPWANKYGVLVGGVVAAAFNLWIGIGNLLYGRKARPLPFAPTDGCPSVVHVSPLSNSTSGIPFLNDTLSCTTVSMNPDSDDPYQYGFFLYDISYEWYAFIGIIVCSSTILIASKLTRSYDKNQTDPRLILPGLRKFWQLEDVPTMEEKDMNTLPISL